MPLLMLVGVTVAGGVVPTASAWINRAVLNAIVMHPAHGSPSSTVMVLAVALGGAGLVSALVQHARNYTTKELRRRITLYVQDALCTALNRFPGLRYHEDPAFADRVRLASDAAQSVPDRLAISGFRGAQALIGAVTMLITVALFNAPLAALVVVSALPAIAMELRLSRRDAGLQWSLSPSARRQIFFRELQTDLRAAKELRIFGLGDFLRQRMLREVGAINRATRALDRRVWAIEGGLSVLTALVTAVGMVWTVAEAAAGRLSVGDVALYVMAVVSIQGSLASVVTSVAATHKGLILFGHYLDLLSMEPDIELALHPTRVSGLRQGIEFRDVWFRYDRRHPWVLEGTNLMIESGKSVALVGLNGAGKSTLVKLLMRMYDPEMGVILWDGVDIRSMDPSELRRRIGVVFQDYMTYELTMSENVGLGAVEALGDSDRICVAARLAGIDPDAGRWPQGLETLLSRIFVPQSGAAVGSTGVVPSGGEWQRLALARALMRRDRELLILDEPSSGLDAEAEYRTHTMLREVRAGRTSVMIAQRLGSIRDADVICVLGGGRIVEAGTHAQLMSLGGEYRRLFTLQASGYAPMALDQDWTTVNARHAKPWVRRGRAM